MAAFGKITWGFVYDKLGFLRGYGAVLILQATVCLSMYYGSYSKFLYSLMITGVFLCQGSHFILFSAVSCDLYGDKYGIFIN